MRLIKLGMDMFGNDVYMQEFGSYNVIMVIAKPRYGKTILVKNIYTQIAESRPVVIFDYQGEHSDSRYGNWHSTDKICFIPDLHTIKDFGFYLSDFDQLADWASMGFSKSAAPLVVDFLRFDKIHHNNPVHFLEFLKDLPTTDDDLARFNAEYAEYGMRLPGRVHDGTKQSMIANMNIVWQSGLIIPPEGSKEHQEYTPNKRHIEDWGDEIWNHRHLSINLSITTSNSIPLARASVGKILEKILPVMKHIKPLIVIEEADYVCPNDMSTENITSLNMLRSYVLKHQRTGVELMFISQDPNLLDQFTLLGATIWIMGQHMKSAVSASVLNEPDLDYQNDIIHKLRFDRVLNKREFALMVAGDGGRYKIFEVPDTYTRDPLRA